MRLKRTTIIGLALFLAFSIVVTWMVFATLQRNISGPTTSYSAIFSDVSGLVEGDDVRVAGVRVGRVDSVELTPANQAKVTFRLRRDQTLYTNTLASVTYQNIIGQRYLGLSQGEGERRKLPAGSQIPEARTNPSFDISYMLNGFEPLFTELDPQQVDNLTNAIIAAFQGRQGSLLALTTQASTLTQTLAGPDAALGDLIANLEPIDGHPGQAERQSGDHAGAVLVGVVRVVGSAPGPRLLGRVDHRQRHAALGDRQRDHAQRPAVHRPRPWFPQVQRDRRQGPVGLRGRQCPVAAQGACPDFPGWHLCGRLRLRPGFRSVARTAQLVRMFVIRATPGNGNEVWHSAVCR